MAIQILPPQLANQIAAGEVVERPASVVKELVENCIDAGATRIDIDIERGGSKLIRIRDNGCGICHSELTLALARHATSKITTLDDLEAIISLGFRGEALASISAVSRLTLTSRTADQQEAWQAYAEGRDQQVTIKPAAHPVGTTVEVLDLFYNTPARRKFMRTEKTEFNHIDEVVRRIALARFDITINLQHNGKMVRQYRAVQPGSARERRLATICGTGFMDHALAIEWQHGDLALNGWVANPPGNAPALAEIQYCYVNGRMMRDRLINHAIRQACEEQAGAERQPAFVLYLQIDPHHVDVNVHPAKHEVRFHESRLVHDFIYQGVLSVLAQQPPLSTSSEEAQTRQVYLHETRPAAGRNQFAEPAPARESSTQARGATAELGQQTTGKNPSGAGGKKVAPLWPHATPGYQQKQGALYHQLLETPQQVSTAEVLQPTVLESHSLSFGRVLTVLHPDIAVLERDNQLAVLSLSIAERWLKQAQMMPSATGEVKPQPLLIPLRIKASEQECRALIDAQPLLRELGIECDISGQQITIRSVPLPLRKQNLQILIHELTRYLMQQSTVTSHNIATYIARHLTSDHTQWNQSQAIALIADVERLCPQLVASPPAGLLQYVDLQSAIRAWKYD